MAASPTRPRLARRLIRPVLCIAVLAVAAYFITRSMVDDLPRLLDLQVSYGMAALSLALFTPAYALFGIGWHLCLVALGGRINLLTSLKLWYVGNMMKYLPGKVMTGIARLERFQTVDVPLRITAAAFAAETILLLCSGGLLFLMTLPWQEGLAAGRAATLTALLAIPMLLVVHPRIFGWLSWRMMRFFRPDAEPMMIPASTLVGILLWFVFAWAVNGLCFWLLCLSFGDKGQTNSARAAAALIGLNAFTWVAGMAAFVTPAGLGVKEGLLGALLVPYFAEAVAGLVSVATRIWMTVGDILGAGLAVALDAVRALLAKGRKADDDTPEPTDAPAP